MLRAFLLNANFYVNFLLPIQSLRNAVGNDAPMEADERNFVTNNNNKKVLKALKLALIDGLAGILTVIGHEVHDSAINLKNIFTFFALESNS